MKHIVGITLTQGDTRILLDILDDYLDTDLEYVPHARELRMPIYEGLARAVSQDEGHDPPITCIFQAIKTLDNTLKVLKTFNHDNISLSHGILDLRKQLTDKVETLQSRV